MVSRAPADRSTVTTDAVVAAALELLGEGGLEAVSFRRIAAKLGVSGPTLYWHVDSKRKLMDLMAEELVRRSGTAYAGPGAGPAVVGVAPRRRPADVRRPDRHARRPAGAGRQPAQLRELRRHRAGAERADGRRPHAGPGAADAVRHRGVRDRQRDRVAGRGRARQGAAAPARGRRAAQRAARRGAGRPAGARRRHPRAAGQPARRRVRVRPGPDRRGAAHPLRAASTERPFTRSGDRA